MSSSIDVTVAAVAERDGRFLIVEERVSNEIVFNQPAGHLEPGESLIDAVVRETREETGYGFQPACIVGIYSWLCDSGKGFLRVCFAGDALPVKGPVTLDDGIIAAHWLSREELLKRSPALRSPLVMRAVDDYLARLRYPLDCVQHIAREFERETKRA